MIWIIVAVVILIIVVIMFVSMEPGGPGVVGLSFGGLAGFFAFFAGNIISAEFVGVDYHLHSTTNIRSMSDVGSTSGEFFLGSGTIDSQPAFWYYADLGTHSELRQALASDAKVIETDGTPHVITYLVESSNKFLSLDRSVDEPPYIYEFYIPEGSIANNFELDARP